MNSQGTSSARLVRRLALALATCVALLGLGAAGASAATIVGQVTADDGGAGLDGVSVCAYGVSVDSSDESCDVTAGEGLFQLTVGTGEYKIEYWPGYSGLNYYSEYFDDRELFSRATRVSVEGSEEFVADAALAEAGQIAGLVTAESGGAPLEEVEVCAFGEIWDCTETDGNGEYTLGGLVEGFYQVEFFPLEGDFMPQYFDNRDRWFEADPVEILTGATRPDVDAELRVGGRIEGGVSAPSGAPLAKIWVCALEASFEELYECDQTDAGGRYVLDRLPSNTYKVVFSPPLFDEEGEKFDDGFLTQYFNAKPTFAAADQLTLTAPGVLTGIDARLVSSALTPPPPLAAAPRPPAPATAAPRAKQKPKVKKCRRGFKKKKVRGKVRCVKVKKAKQRKRGNAERRLLEGGFRVRIQP